MAAKKRSSAQAENAPRGALGGARAARRDGGRRGTGATEQTLLPDTGLRTEETAAAACCPISPTWKSRGGEGRR